MLLYQNASTIIDEYSGSWNNTKILRFLSFNLSIFVIEAKSSWPHPPVSISQILGLKSCDSISGFVFVFFEMGFRLLETGLELLVVRICVVFLLLLFCFETELLIFLLAGVYPQAFFFFKLLHLYVCLCQCQGKSQESSSPMSIPCILSTKLSFPPCSGFWDSIWMPASIYPVLRL